MGLEADDLQGVTRQTLAELVYAQLKTAITRGRLRDGAELKQVELAAQLGVSRVPVREALRRLQAEHLVVAKPFQCFVVTSLTRDQVIELMEVREELEVWALKNTLKSGDYEERLTRAREAASAFNLDQDHESWLDADRAFHRAMSGETTAVAAIIDDIRERVHRYLYLSPVVVSRRREVVRQHVALLAALQAKDERALEDAIRAHVRGTRDHFPWGYAEAGPSSSKQTSGLESG